MLNNNNPKSFDKYEKFGAYHFKWYATNKFKYRDQVDYVLTYFPNKGTVLDIGCGDGLISLKLVEKNLIVTGIDTNNSAIIFAKEKCKSFIQNKKLHFEVKSVYTLNTKNKYDYILLHDVIEHLEKPKLALEKIHATMNSYCIISIPNANYHKPKQYDYQFWTPEELPKLFNEFKYNILSSGSTILISMYKSENARN